MAIRDILLLGDPRLLEISAPVGPAELDAAIAIGRDLLDTLRDFRTRRGWGRAISAPQIGVARRIVCLRVDRPWLILNPVVTDPSADLMEIWDDCMSFPDLLVRLRRHVAFTLRWRDERWDERALRVEGLLSELLQHEIDHLDGVLAVARAIDGGSFALQSQRHRLRGAAFANEPGAASG